jgi:cytochrome c5
LGTNEKGIVMQSNRRVKLISIFMGMLFYSNIIQAHTLGDALTGSANVTSGAKEWANNCARCHNLRSPTEFSADNWQIIMLHMRIQSGVTGQVARNIYAFLSGQNIETKESVAVAQTQNNAVMPITSVPAQQNTKLSANTAKTTSNNQQVQKNSQVTSSQSGEAIYQQTCVVCHGANGKGAIPGVPDFTGSSGPLANSDAVLLERIIKGYQSPGAPMAMPARGGNPKLTDDDLKKALIYMRNKFGK